MGTGPVPFSSALLPLCVAFPPNRPISSKVRVFIEWVTELMAEQAPVAEHPGSGE
ncbi:MAG: hypothetical protein ACRYF9_20350 [Janthinobacterium lividum]